MDGDGTAFTLTTMSIDAGDKLLIDAALAFSSVNQHGAFNFQSLPVASGKLTIKLQRVSSGFRGSSPREEPVGAERGVFA